MHLAVIFHPLKLLLRIVRITTCGYFSVITKKTLLHATGWSSDNMHVSAGGMAGICSWVTTYPQDVIKSRVQGDGWGKHQRYHGPRHCLRVKIHTNKSVSVNSYIQCSGNYQGGRMENSLQRFWINYISSIYCEWSHFTSVQQHHALLCITNMLAKSTIF